MVNVVAALARREQEAGWGDVRRGVYESLIRWSLLRLASRPMTARNRHPHLLVFVDDAEHRLDLIRFGTWFSQGRGVVTVCEPVAFGRWTWCGMGSPGSPTCPRPTALPALTATPFCSAGPPEFPGWWSGMQHNGDLMLLLAHLITRNPEWRDARIRVLSVASNEHMKANTERYLEWLIPEFRISAAETSPGPATESGSAG
jgi:hypothetical protein